MKIDSVKVNNKFKFNSEISRENTENKFEVNFSKFVSYSLRIIFIIILIGSVAELIYFSIFNGKSLSIALIILYGFLCLNFYFLIKKNLDKRIMITLIILLGLILRVIWAFSLDNVPVSDFGQVYEAAISLNNKDYSPLMGSSYFGRFPHLIILVLYFSRIIFIFKENSLIGLKIVNIMFSTSSILLIYLILNEVFKDYKKVIIGSFISAIMPASILYTPVYCSENIAIPFYLGSIYCFILVMNKKSKQRLLIFSAILLLIGHLFRMVGQIMIISYIMYLIIYFKSLLIDKIKCITYILVSFIVPLIIISNLLICTGITDQKLWGGSEPHITSILKGSNIESFGRWNEEDAELIGENLNNKEYLDDVSKSKIIYRYTNTNIFKLSAFILVKLSSQWCQGDFGGSFWAQSNISHDKIMLDIYNKGNIWYQVCHILMLILIIKGLTNKKLYLQNTIIKLFYIIFCGYGITFLILECQERYGFIISWVFIIISMISIDKPIFNFGKYHINLNSKLFIYEARLKKLFIHG